MTQGNSTFRGIAVAVALAVPMSSVAAVATYLSGASMAMAAGVLAAGFAIGVFVYVSIARSAGHQD